MPDVKPTVLRRMLTLRQFPLFSGAALDELATMAENVEAVRYPAGTVIAHAASRLPALELVVEGRIASLPDGPAWGPRHVFGALEVAAGREIATAAFAATDTETLQLSAEDFGDVLEDNFGVMVSALRDLAARLSQSFGVVPRTPSVGLVGVPLGLVQRLILLRQQMPFATARLHGLAALAHASDEVSWPGGAIVARAGELATAGLVIIDGTVEVRTQGGRVHMLGPGDSFGLLETLGGIEHAFVIETQTPVRALRCTSHALLDVLEDHTDVGLAMIAAFSSALLDMHAN